MYGEDTDSSSDDSLIDKLVNDFILDDTDAYIIATVKPKIMSKPKEAIVKSNFWSDVYPLLSDNAFKSRYRRSRESFNSFAEQHFARSPYKNMQRWIKALSITIDYLSTGVRVQDLVLLYDSAQGKIFMDIDCCISFLEKCVLPLVCQWPDEVERGHLAALNWIKYKMPMCLGAIDGTLVKIKGYQPNRKELNCRKSHFAYNVLLVCDFNGLIRFYVCGSPGAMSDVTIYEESDLFANLAEWLKNSNRLTHPFYLISDKGIPNTDYIVTPFPDDGRLSAQQLRFNYIVQSARSIIERVNGIFKQRYQILNRVLAVNTERKAQSVIKACLALYNDEIIRGDLKLYSQKPDLEENSVISMFNEYDRSPYVNQFSGSREFLYDFIHKNVQEQLRLEE